MVDEKKLVSKRQQSDHTGSFWMIKFDGDKYERRYYGRLDAEVNDIVTVEWKKVFKNGREYINVKNITKKETPNSFQNQTPWGDYTGIRLPNTTIPNPQPDEVKNEIIRGYTLLHNDFENIKIFLNDLMVLLQQLIKVPQEEIPQNPPEN